MKMLKPSERDIDAAGDALGILSDIRSGYYPSKPDDEDPPTHFDERDPAHLRRFYDLISATFDRSPTWPTRVIGGMCYVICFDRNAILDPVDDCIGLHPDLRAGLAMLNRHRSEFLTTLERGARAAVADTIERAATRHLTEMRCSEFRALQRAST